MRCGLGVDGSADGIFSGESWSGLTRSIVHHQASRRLRLAQFLGAVLAASTVACSTRAGETASNTTNGLRTTDTSSSTSVGPQRDFESVPRQRSRQPAPLDRYRLTAEQQKFVYDSWQSAMRACMAERGFEFEITDLSSIPERPGTPTEPADIRKYGYDVPPGAAKPVRSSNDERVASDPAFRQAFIGREDDDTDGCRDVASAAVYGRQHRFIALDNQIQQAMIEASQKETASDAQASLDRRWSACMSRAGYTFSSPTKALERFVGNANSAEEVSTRFADLRCQAEVDYDYTVSVLENDAQTAWMEKNMQLLRDVEGARSKYLRDLEIYVAKLR